MIKLAFIKYLDLGLLNSSNKVDLVAQSFKCVTSLSFCNLIGPPKSWRTDPKRYGQSPRLSLRVFILKELNAACGGRSRGLVSRLGGGGGD